MNVPFISDKTYKNINYTNTNLPKAEYDNCTFINCNFSESYISTISFMDCEFIDCNFSMVKAKDAIFKDVLFNNCKLVGFPFHDCNSFLMSMTFKSSQLNFASFQDLKLKETTFDQC
ncbi:pentapeptide repeat-containing protein [Psychroserpens luteolus]|uniref:pentapeptide repeat-containing protein n=1 Tax=Psychroserpens luteolus TaxID=2855840 RepID=UPI001E593FEF|nr:pentapeptide repeat-containing protein [Psychroserpens luteolus]